MPPRFDWEDIDGWLSIEAGAQLQGMAARRDVLELGSYLGRSTVCMAQGARSVTSVDTHRGDANTGPADTLERFLRNLDDAGVRDRVTVITSPIETADLGGATFDLVFIDAQHDAASVERHTRIALAVLRPGGVIAWHDWSYPTVKAGVAACGLSPRPGPGDLAILQTEKR